jgi:periplasmic divalent cation tolerance protein
MRTVMLIVLTTSPTFEEAEVLAQKIVSERLAACVQVLPPVNSFYFWEGKMQSETEHLILIKTLEEKYPSLEKFIGENHSYEVPEIVALSAQEVSESYLGWMKEILEK